MRILVITSCTGDKAVDHERALKLEDFQQGPAHVAEREKELTELLTPAEELYTGLQHVRLMRGVKQFREKGSGALDLWILSAGYGLVPADQKLAPYECTFQGMKKAELRRWADALDVPAQIRRVLAQPYDLALVLLGDSYLEACALDDQVKLGGPAVLFCGAGMARKLPKLDGMKVVPLGNPDARRFSCALVGLKGELAARVLEQAEAGVAAVDITMSEVGEQASLDQVKAKREIARPNSNVDKVISIPSDWWEKPHRAKLRYFIPEWDDLVDPNYDFHSDTHSGGSADWSNETYAHQLYPEPNYDGILISKVVAEKSTKKRERINQLGVHRFLRLPRQFPVMGDCGAFGYIEQARPPYTTEEILDYYTRLGFDYGVSIDHLIVSSTEADKRMRYELTIHNAAEFIKEHRARSLDWEPIGAVQGWNPTSYAQGARQVVSMGYNYIGLGGLVRTNTIEILRILHEVHKVVPPSVGIHLFGIARPDALRHFSDLGVTSVDSASFLRRAWMGTGKNYLSESGEWYAAIRIPEAGKSFRAKRMVAEGRMSADRVENLEKTAMKMLIDYDQGQASVQSVIEVISELDRLITPDRPDNTSLLRRTLEEAPWRKCSCSVCRKDGIQVIIFRGNNRNRRRGFHNTYVFYRLIQRVLAGEPMVQSPSGYRHGHQLTFFNTVDEGEE